MNSRSEVSVEELREKCEPRNGFTIVLVFLFVSVVVLVVGVTLRGRGRGRGAGAGAGAGGGGEGGRGDVAAQPLYEREFLKSLHAN